MTHIYTYWGENVNVLNGQEYMCLQFDMSWSNWSVIFCDFSLMPIWLTCSSYMWILLSQLVLQYSVSQPLEINQVWKICNLLLFRIHLIQTNVHCMCWENCIHNSGFFLITVGYSGAYHKLVPQRPPGSLVKPNNLLSIIAQILLVIIFQISAFLYLHFQPW